MFNILTSKLGEAQAFADGLGNPLEALSMDRLRDEEERKETLMSQQNRTVRQSRRAATEAGGGVVDDLVLEPAGSNANADRGRTPPRLASRTPLGSPGVLRIEEGSHESLSMRSKSRSTTPVCRVEKNADASWGGGSTARRAELEMASEPKRVSAKDGTDAIDMEDANPGGLDDGSGNITGGTAHSASLSLVGSDGEDGNFEDEFDPILASIRKPPQLTAALTASPATSFTSSTSGVVNKQAHSTAGGDHNSNSLCRNQHGDEKGTIPEDDQGKRPSVGVSFAAGFLSIFPGDMRARAGDVMAQSSAQMSKTADALRFAVESGINSGNNRGKRRPRGGYVGVDDQGVEMEEGQGAGGDSAGGGSSGRRLAGGGKGRGGDVGDEDDVTVSNVNDLLSEEEVFNIQPFLSTHEVSSLSSPLLLSFSDNSSLLFLEEEASADGDGYESTSQSLQGLLYWVCFTCGDGKPCQKMLRALPEKPVKLKASRLAPESVDRMRK